MTSPREQASVPPASEACRDCGYDELNCRCDCTHCCGEGIVEGGDPGWYLGQLVDCYACKGTGRRRDQVIF